MAQEAGRRASDHLGLHQAPGQVFSVRGGTCLFMERLIERGRCSLAEECQAEGVSIILGPAANIKRSPLVAEMEYFSEDPYLSSQMAASHKRRAE